MVTKVMTDTALHRMADEPSPCLQCHHGQHNSTTSHPAALWPQDHDDSHARMSTRRRRSLQAKLARTSLKLSTLRSREPPLCISPGPELYIRTNRETHSGHPLRLAIVFLEQRGNRINLLVRFTKYRQLACQVGDSRALSIVERESGGSLHRR